jgi:glutathione peroxidase
MSFFDLTATTLDGREQSMAAYQGKVLLVANTASECGFTPQYADLEKLWQEYRDRGLVVMGFPSNEFGQQEPGTAEEIRGFCDLKFHVTFPMFAKVLTKGDGRSRVFSFLTAKHPKPRWNFYKYLIGRDGEVADYFVSITSPDSKRLRRAVEKALG